MIFLKWFCLCILDLLAHVSLLVAPPIIALFTREMPYGQRPYTWGGLWGTWDNPPQGDRGFVTEHATFINCSTGIKGYVNRVHWMWRNKLYGLAKIMSIQYVLTDVVTFTGDADISDKYKKPGYYFAKLHRNGKLIGFEYYLIKPWAKTRDIRVRLGWKMMTDKFQKYGFAQFVNTANPFDGYGEQ